MRLTFLACTFAAAASAAGASTLDQILYACMTGTSLDYPVLEDPPKNIYGPVQDAADEVFRQSVIQRDILDGTQGTIEEDVLVAVGEGIEMMKAGIVTSRLKQTPVGLVLEWREGTGFMGCLHVLDASAPDPRNTENDLTIITVHTDGRRIVSAVGMPK